MPYPQSRHNVKKFKMVAMFRYVHHVENSGETYKLPSDVGACIFVPSKKF